MSDHVVRGPESEAPSCNLGATGCDSLTDLLPSFALEACGVMRLPRKQENSVQLRARASLVAEQTGLRLLSGCIPVRVRARGSTPGALVHAVRREPLKLQNGVQIPGAS